jgi:site-specific DNA-methyltransferase (adenine-specific)
MPDLFFSGMSNKIHLGDCLSVMATLPEHSVSAVVTDLPYGTTYAPWDSTIRLDRLWEAIKYVMVPGGAVVMTASQPFTSVLVMSNLRWFRCEWIWDKVNAANFANAKRQPLKVHESVLIFCERQPYYKPERVPGAVNHKQGKSTRNVSETRLIHERVADDLSGLKYPKSIQTFPKHSSQCRLHSTQKPVDLLRYFIRAYTQPQDLILDPACGSGSTCEAARLEDRRYIGIDNDPKCVEIAIERVCQPR